MLLACLHLGALLLLAGGPEVPAGADPAAEQSLYLDAENFVSEVREGNVRRLVLRSPWRELSGVVVRDGLEQDFHADEASVQRHLLADLLDQHSIEIHVEGEPAEVPASMGWWSTAMWLVPLLMGLILVSTLLLCIGIATKVSRIAHDLGQRSA